METRPTVDNFSVSMTTDGSLNVMGIGTGDSKSSSLFNGISGMASSVFSSENSLVSEAPFNTSEYKKVEESGFLSVKTSPLSTFAADVDTASYTNFRNIINSTIKSEDYYDNYYNYSYSIADDIHDVRIEN